MRPLLTNTSLMLTIPITFIIALSSANPHVKHGSFHNLAGRDGGAVATTTCISEGCAASTSTTNSYCASASSGLEGPSDFTVTCGIDIPGQNIAPFLLVENYDACFGECLNFNDLNNETKCEGFVFAPERTADADDCYLKSGLAFPMAATIPLIGATMTTQSSAATTLPSPTRSIIPIAPLATANLGNVLPGSSSKAPTPATLSVKNVNLLGSSSNKPATHYVSHVPYPAAKLTSGQLVPGINANLITGYGMASDTGCWNDNDFKIQPTIAQMKTTPHTSRDGGKGGNVNGSNIFVFCDTGNYYQDEMLGFVSSSVAVDHNMNALDGKAITLVDRLGEFQDDVGRMRGFAPLTEGEEAFNTALSGDGYRYAVWPESAPITLNSTHALMYANLIYDNVDMDTQAYNLTNIGNTLLLVSVDSTYGPYASRIVNQLFVQHQVAYGSLGGFRAWTDSGVGSNDGTLYLFAHVQNGVMVAKTSASSYTDLTTYKFWDGHKWNTGMPDQDNDNALILKETILDFDIIYAPAYDNFIMIYTTYNPDNTFYYRFVDPKHNKANLIAPYKNGGNDNYAEAIVTGTWSARAKLYQAPDPAVGSLYAGAVHQGYFGNNDITNGGKKMLLTWTEHTGQDATSEATGYALMSAVVEFD